MSGSRNTAEIVIAVSAIVTAVIALVVGVWENVQEREHNRLSVMPSLVFSLEAAERTGPDGEPPEVPTVAIRMINQGVGPAVMQDLTIEIIDEFGQASVHASIFDASPALGELGIDLGTRADLSPGSVIGIGQSLLLAELEFADAAPGAESYPLIRDLLNHLHIRVEYESIYGDSFTSELDR